MVIVQAVHFIAEHDGHPVPGKKRHYLLGHLAGSMDVLSQPARVARRADDKVLPGDRLVQVLTTVARMRTSSAPAASFAASWFSSFGGSTSTSRKTHVHHASRNRPDVRGRLGVNQDDADVIERRLVCIVPVTAFVFSIGHLPGALKTIPSSIPLSNSTSAEQDRMRLSSIKDSNIVKGKEATWTSHKESIID